MWFYREALLRHKINLVLTLIFVLMLSV